MVTLLQKCTKHAIEVRFYFTLPISNRLLYFVSCDRGNEIFLITVNFSSEAYRWKKFKWQNLTFCLLRKKIAHFLQIKKEDRSSLFFLKIKKENRNSFFFCKSRKKKEAHVLQIKKEDRSSLFANQERRKKLTFCQSRKKITALLANQTHQTHSDPTRI